MALPIRTLLIWLLALALPAQAAAAATMAFCGPQHEHAAVAVQPHSATPAQHAHGEAGRSGHSHADGVLAAGEVADAAADSAVDLAPDSGSGGQPRCSACASCCSAGAIAQTPLSVPSAAPGRAEFSDLVTGVSTLALAGPERPPRSPLA